MENKHKIVVSVDIHYSHQFMFIKKELDKKKMQERVVKKRGIKNVNDAQNEKTKQKHE